ncbi:MAG: microcompartment protein CcmL/EutN [Planctomycetota bacterium]|jgi:microcompartment protein CcmL/EutN
MDRNDKNPALSGDVKMGPAIALLELCSVARGVEVADAILWEANIEMLFSTPVQPGRYVMLFTGSIDDLRGAMRRGSEIAGGDLVDDLMIPNIHEQVELGLRRTGVLNGTIDALGVVETKSVASSIQAADVALKSATVDLLELRIANGLGGKSYFSVTGEVSDVRSAVFAGSKCAEGEGQLARQVVIPRPHPELVQFL